MIFRKDAGAWLPAILILLCALPLAAQEARPVGTVQALEGAVHAVTQASGERRQLAGGRPLFEGDLVQTAANGRVALRLADDSVLRLGSNTDLRLSWVLADSASGIRQIALAISRGIVRTIVDVVFPQSAVEIETATAVTSVRGTDWITEAQVDTSAVVALDGRVTVRSATGTGAAVVLGPGEGTDVARDAAPSAPATWGAARRASFIQRTAPPSP